MSHCYTLTLKHPIIRDQVRYGAGDHAGRAPHAAIKTCSRIILCSQSASYINRRCGGVVNALDLNSFELSNTFECAGSSPVSDVLFVFLSSQQDSFPPWNECLASRWIILLLCSASPCAHDSSMQSYFYAVIEGSLRHYLKSEELLCLLPFVPTPKSKHAGKLIIPESEHSKMIRPRSTRSTSLPWTRAAIWSNLHLVTPFPPAQASLAVSANLLPPAHVGSPGNSCI